MGTRRSLVTLSLAFLLLVLTVGLIAAGGVALADEPGVTASEVKIGNTAPYSGPASAYGTILKTSAAYFKMINDRRGVNGRKIVFISYDDGYSPPRTVEMTRKLVEQDHVLLDFAPLGTPCNSAIWSYMNRHKVPQLFVLTGASKWGDPKDHPWTMGWQPTYSSEAATYAKYILEKMPQAKIGILYQNDDYGKDYVNGFRRGLGDKGRKLIVMEQTYETTDPTIDSQIVNLKNIGANVFFDVTTPKFASQAIRKAYEIGWHPVHFLNNVSASVGSVLKPAGLEASKGLVTALYEKDVTDPRWEGDPGVKEYLAFMKKYYPQGDATDGFNVTGYLEAQTMVYVLKRAGKNLSRANIMKVAANIHDLRLPLLLPGVRIHTTPTDFYPIEQRQLARFDGQRWELFGKVYDVSGMSR